MYVYRTIGSGFALGSCKECEAGYNELTNFTCHAVKKCYAGYRTYSK